MLRFKERGGKKKVVSCNEGKETRNRAYIFLKNKEKARDCLRGKKGEEDFPGCQIQQAGP